MIDYQVVGELRPVLGEAVCAAGGTLFSLCDFENPGLRRRSRVFRRGKTDNVAAVVDFASEVKPDLVIVGLERLAALVPRPRRPLLAYHGVLAPRARMAIGDHPDAGP